MEFNLLLGIFIHIKVRYLYIHRADEERKDLTASLQANLFLIPLLVTEKVNTSAGRFNAALKERSELSEEPRMPQNHPQSSSTCRWRALP